MTNAQRNVLGELRKKDNKSLWLIQQGLEEYIFPKVAATDHAKHAWDILEITYQGTNKVKNAKLQTLRKSFETLQMKDSDSVDHFMTHITSIVNQLCTHGEDIQENKFIEKVLRSLPDKFNMVVVSIEESKDLSTLTVEELMGSLLTHENRFSRNTESLENTFQSQASISRGRGRGNRRRGRRGRGRSQTGERSTSECSEQSEQSEQRHSQNQRGRGRNFNQSRWTDKSRISAIIARNLVTTKVNAERSKQI
jgi:hypothetical protein